MTTHRPRLVRTIALAGALASFATATPAFAWGDSGHRMIGTLAIETLPGDVPAFLRGPHVAADVGEWAREPDRWRGAGRVHDDMRDPGHFIDVLDNGQTLAGVTLDHLPPTRTDFETALAQHGETIAHSGFLPYNIVDGYQQLVKDFTTWRADRAALKLDKNPAHRAWLEADLRRREEQTIMDLGIWGHYVGDATQPLHVSVHYNGWGKGPNPHGFTDCADPCALRRAVRTRLCVDGGRARGDGAVQDLRLRHHARKPARYLEATRAGGRAALSRSTRPAGLRRRTRRMVALATKQSPPALRSCAI